MSLNKSNCCLFFMLIMALLISCRRDNDQPSPIGASDRFAECNNHLSACFSVAGDYCLFGYKWGANTTFDNTGANAIGPKESGGIVTYSFQESNGLVNTHRQVDLPGRSFDELINCAKEEIRNAINTWSVVANIQFEELNDNSDGDIRFFVADIVQSGVGYPNFDGSLCDPIKGTMVIKTDIAISSCEDFYAFALHEMGHILGLGHVNSETIMNPDFYSLGIRELQEGDKKGIIEIYGKK